jgi:hypothetical protein
MEDGEDAPFSSPVDQKEFHMDSMHYTRGENRSSPPEHQYILIISVLARIRGRRLWRIDLVASHSSHLASVVERCGVAVAGVDHEMAALIALDPWPSQQDEQV